jgi:hypothetical protein
MRGPYARTGRWSGQESARRIARWWHSQHDRSSAPHARWHACAHCQGACRQCPSFRHDPALQEVKSWAMKRLMHCKKSRSGPLPPAPEADVAFA